MIVFFILAYLYNQYVDYSPRIKLRIFWARSWELLASTSKKCFIDPGGGKIHITNFIYYILTYTILY